MEEKKIKNAEAEAPKALDTEQLDQVAGGTSSIPPEWVMTDE